MQNCKIDVSIPCRLLNCFIFIKAGSGKNRCLFNTVTLLNISAAVSIALNRSNIKTASSFFLSDIVSYRFLR